MIIFDDTQSITFEELDLARANLYRGMAIPICDYRNERKKISGTVRTWSKHVIVFENGLSYTMQEYAMYLRDRSKAVGGHFKRT